MGGETIDKLVIQIKSDIASALRGLDNVDRKMDKLDSNTKDAANSIDRSTTKMSQSFGALKAGAVAAAAAAVIAVAATGKKILDTSSDMEQYMITLETLYGSQQRAAEQLQWVLEFAKETPFEIDGLVDSTIKLQAFGLEAQDVLETLGDTAAATSKPIDQVVNAFGRLSVGDTGQAVAMFRDIGVNLKNIEGLQWDARGAMVTPIEEALPLVQRYLDTEFGGLMEKQSQSLKGISSNIVDTLSQAGLAFAGFETDTATFREGSLFDRAKDSIDGLLSSLSNIDATGAGKSIEEILAAWDRFSAQLEPAKKAASEAFGSIKGIIADFRQGLSGADVDFSSIAKVINLIAIAIAKVAGFLDKYNIGEKLGKIVKSNIELYTKFHRTIVDKFIGGLNLAIDAYNKLVPLMQKAGMDVEKANKVTFEGMTATVEEEMQKQADAVNSGYGDSSGAGGGGSSTGTSATGSGAIPSWAGQSDYIREQLAATGGKTIDDLLTPSLDSATAAPTVIQAGTPHPTAKNETSSKLSEIAVKLEEVIAVLKQEPRKVDIDMDIDIENKSDISSFENTLAEATAAGVHGKVKVIG